MNDLTPQPEGPDETSSFLAQTLQNLGEALTGIAASEKKDLFLSLGYILQRTRNGKFLRTLREEWDKYRAKGRIDEDYIKSEQHEECLQELLDFLDNDSPDRVRFSAMKQIFLNAASERFATRDDILPQQLMRLARKLASGDVILLSSIYEISKQDVDCETLVGGSASEWIRHAAENSPLKYKELIEIHESTLMNFQLISARVYGDRSGIERTNKHFRLTPLGLELCRFMLEHDTDGA